MIFLLSLSIFDCADELMPFDVIFEISIGHLGNDGDKLAEAYMEDKGETRFQSVLLRFP